MTKRIFITGIVQGVGFRPCCKKAADEMQLSGTVRNLGSNAEIVIRSDNRVTEEFLCRLVSLLPKEARIDNIDIQECEEFLEEGFTICESSVSDEFVTEIIPDIATCDTCLLELENKSDRRYEHPFISCTACGPRYSIIKSLPYDRENTLMDEFPMCGSCRTEYTDPVGRRLHAQTIACNDCGPKLSFFPDNNNTPINAALEALTNGGVIAVKDVGGYHFVCLPENINAVEQLRQLKLREQKPFAVMFQNIELIKEYADVNDKEQELLLSPARPIVLLEKRKDFAGDVCNNSRFIGAMLPSNPVQHMLTKACGRLVMTSGNISGEPIITDNAQILEICKNSDLLNGVLYHNREIITPLDDSIYYVLDDTQHLARRGRGVAPASISIEGRKDIIFAAGGDLKSCFGFYKNGKAVLSQHFGDLEDDGCAEVFEKSSKHISTLFNFKPNVAVCDMHPSYFSSSLTEKLYDFKPIKVQHHHAHIASVMAEHNLDQCLGFALDGTGYGTDGSIWGGEALLCSGSKFKRIAHLKSVTMCGGDEVSKNAKESLACYLLAGGMQIPDWLMRKSDSEIITAAVANQINCIKTSSCGRLFDAVCCLLGFSDYNYYEGLCATSLENAADIAIKRKIVAYPLKMNYNDGVLDSVKLVCDILKAKTEGADPYALALGFHYALADGLLRVAKSEKMPKIALSGGTFNNRILTLNLKNQLEKNGFKVYLNEKVPCGDGGLALGQLFLAARKD